ncbi:group I truncated hemoglobin [Fodinicola feengrottensis]|uniref:Group 1 truncated hemoglobin n=1 Tax=Fodinicola feengrottensis TaxID=435914 RepID=A0ABN2FST9_9ACTN|nr:group 1 truncated hemoglobin [Fodinicola feengrottensis]
MSAPETSIYQAIGGDPALVAVVDDFYARVMADPKLAGFFAGINLKRLKGMQVEFFAAALGGPLPYAGRSMSDAHTGRGISMEHFNMVAGHLGDSLAAAGVPDHINGQIIGAIAPLADDIVAKHVIVF